MKDPNHCWVVLGFCYNLSVQVFEKISNSSNLCAGLLLKLPTKVISGSGYLKTIQKDWLVSSKNQLRTKGSG
jgi:hypothetical protein